MASPTDINILISVRNRASEPLKQVTKDVKNVRDQMVLFNRSLFTAAAAYAAFSGILRGGFNLAKTGAQFDFFREQFNSTFGGPNYLTTLRAASQGTMDAMSMMQIAVQNHARGMQKAETEKIFTLSVGAAKLLGTTTAQAAAKMSKAMQTLSISSLQSFFVSLNTNNQFNNMNLILQRLTKGINAAGMKANVFRRVAMRELEIVLGEVSARGGDARQSMAAMGASFESLKGVSANFLARGLGPLAAFISRKVWGYFDRLNEILGATDGRLKDVKNGLINLAQVGGAVIAAGTGLFAAWAPLSIMANVLGVSLGTIVGTLGTLAFIIKGIAGPSKTWLDILADTGTVLKFIYQTFESFDPNTGIATYTGDVADSIKGMGQTAQSWIFKIGKAIAWLKTGFKSFSDTIKTQVDFISGLLNKIGFGSGATTFQKGGMGLGLAEGLGSVAAIALPLIGAYTGLKGILGKFGIGGGASGKGPKGTSDDPIYTASSVLGQGPGAFLGVGPALVQTLGKTNLVLGALAAGLGLGLAADSALGLSDKISSFLAFGSASGKDENNLSNSIFTSGAKKELGNKNLNSLVAQANSSGDTQFPKDLANITADGLVTQEEMVRLLASIDRALKNKPFVSSKPNDRM